MNPDPDLTESDLSDPELSGSDELGGDDLSDLGYAAAAAELDEILERLDRDTVDVDDLARQVRRAADLIRHCRSRITGARIEVERVSVELADLAVADPESDV